MTEPRRPLKVSVRFEVFKRDNFTCAYCGRTPPEVLLHADHIVPVVDGGLDTLDNLITACTDCNLGKGAKTLAEGVRPAVPRVAVEELEERIEQAKAYMEALGQRASIVERKRWMVVEHWAKLFGATAEERETGTVWVLSLGRFPDEASVLRFLRQLSVDDVLQAIEITASKYSVPNDTACRYFYGICWRAIRENRPVGGPAPGASEPLVATKGAVDEAFHAGFASGQEDGRYGEYFRIRALVIASNQDGRDIDETLKEIFD